MPVVEHEAHEIHVQSPPRKHGARVHTCDSEHGSLDERGENAAAVELVLHGKPVVHWPARCQRVKRACSAENVVGVAVERHAVVLGELRDIVARMCPGRVDSEQREPTKLIAARTARPNRTVRRDFLRAPRYPLTPLLTQLK